MCGICGIVSNSGRPDADAVAAMTETIVHRGPDSGGVDVFGTCALGHRRLAVIDLVSGDQPFTNERGDIAVVANCEIYNFRELRRDLQRRGHELRGTNDVAAVPHLYEEYGLDFARHLSGMYAIALWDARRERLVLVRDRVGKKPLVWTQLADGSLAFASELRALLALPGVDRTLDLDALDAYLALQYVPSPQTIVRGIQKLPPAHVLSFERGRVELQRYWEPRVEERELPDDEWLERVRSTVRDAVTRRLAADVPLGALLSGGIDSTIVVAQLAEAVGTVRTFTVGFPEARYDERPLARLVSERYATDHVEVAIDEPPQELLPRLAHVLDEPLGDSSALPTWLVSQEAVRHVTVALTGDGGDESFAGYERYGATEAAQLAGRVPGWALRGGARALRSLAGSRPDVRAPLIRAARFASAAAAPPAERYGRLMEVFPPELRAGLWSSDALERLGRLRSAGELLGAPPRGGTTGLQLLDLATYLPGDLLRKADLCSMAVSLELRSPLLDERVIELGLSLPDSLKRRGRRGKLALRRAFADRIPAELLDRPKTGFGVPVADWFRGPLRELAGDVLLDARARGRGLFRADAVEALVADHAAGRSDHGHRLWTLVMLELWQRELDGATAAPAARAAS